jgi:PKD repeat protein
MKIRRNRDSRIRAMPSGVEITVPRALIFGSGLSMFYGMHRTTCLMLTLLLAAFMSCSSHQGSGAARAKPVLKLRASPRQGLAPMIVAFNATLSGVSEHDEKYYCMEVSWDFGDGAVSVEEPNCDPFGPDTKITTKFLAEHTYHDLGSYTVRLNIGKEEEQEIVRANSVNIKVLSTDLEKRY